MIETLRIPFDELFGTLEKILVGTGFAADDAAVCARLFTETTCDGVYTHGLARFPRFMATIKNGCVLPTAKPIPLVQMGALERWDGQRGPGNLNARAMMARAIDLADQHGIGCVALANTNHWMRGGTYGWQAAEAGVIGMCWTNTLPNLPAWGGTKPVLGNNPLVIAVPRILASGAAGHVVLDMAMSQFSYGTLAAYREKQRPLPVDGGFDADGKLTRDAAAIEATMRPLPIGYWKGSGLALVLDMMAAMLSGGLSTSQIATDPLLESGVSQIFIAMDLQGLQGPTQSESIADGILQFFATGGDGVRYPGERVLQVRAENMVAGVPVDPSLWAEVKGMLG